MTVTQLTSVPVNMPEVQLPLVQSLEADRSIEAGLGVHSLFRPSIVHASGKHGLRWAILRVLAAAPDVGLTTAQVISRVRTAESCFHKHPDKTFSDVLCTVLKREAGHVVSVQRSNRQDRNRNCDRPRKVWFITPEGLKALAAKKKAARKLAVWLVK